MYRYQPSGDALPRCEDDLPVPLNTKAELCRSHMLDEGQAARAPIGLANQCAGGASL